MNEVEKRLGLDAWESNQLKERLRQHFCEPDYVARTLLIKVEGKDFEPDPDCLLDIKIKLIADQSVWSMKHGSWHKDSCRKEYEVNFRRDDLENVIEMLSLQNYKHFVLFSTVRSIWKKDGCIYTIDDYKSLDKALFEVEAKADDHRAEACVTRAFKDLELTPMSSPETISFIHLLNKDQAAQIDLNVYSAREIAE